MISASPGQKVGSQGENGKVKQGGRGEKKESKERKGKRK